MSIAIYVDPRRAIAKRDPMIYGHFLEHFHRQIYGGIYDPTSPLSDSDGVRKDVMDAIRNIEPAVIRWPGGCFVSAYHWKDAIGHTRQPQFDKAWRVEESNEFGTDEYIAFCRKVNAEPYICTNAGTGSPEEMSDWVEYCNLKTEGKWAKKRIENGHTEPYRVKYWSIGNENYLSGEMGSKTISEWGRFVRESAKMMKRVDPSIEIFAASVAPDKMYNTVASPFDWNVSLLKEAGHLLDWISIHGYWDRLNRISDSISPYEACMVFSTRIEQRILSAKHILGSMGLLGKIRISFDEWNLRCWHHPHVDSATKDFLTPRDINDVNAQYTMADAIFTACFLNQCLKYCDVVGMANFSPTVNTRGAIFTHKDGIVLRSTYHVFELYTKHMGDTVIDSWADGDDTFDVSTGGETVKVPFLDIVATKNSNRNDLRLSIVNRHPDKTMTLKFEITNLISFKSAILYTIGADDKDAYNDIDQPDSIKISQRDIDINDRNGLTLEFSPHSVNVLVVT